MKVPDAWLPPSGKHDACKARALENHQAVEANAKRIEQDSVAAEQLQVFLAAAPYSPDAEAKPRFDDYRKANSRATHELFLNVHLPVGHR